MFQANQPFLKVKLSQALQSVTSRYASSQQRLTEQAEASVASIAQALQKKRDFVCDEEAAISGLLSLLLFIWLMTDRYA